MSNERERLSQMATGYWLSKMVYVAAKLGLADRLASGPLSVSALASSVGAQSGPLHRLMRGLASVGVFVEGEPQVFALNPAAEYLRDDHPQSVRPLTIMAGETQFEAWADLLHSVQTGQTGFEHRFGRPLFDYLGDHPEQAAMFDRAMVSIHGRETAAILDAYDFRSFKRIVDIGGGNASQMVEILQKHRNLSGMVFDLPHVVERARDALQRANLANRCDTRGGSFFEEVPAGGDAYLLRHIIHDWDDAASAAILKTIRKAIPAHGKLLVIETVIPPGNDPCFAKLLDLTMLVIPGGLERTQDQYTTLLADAGFQLTRVVPTTGGVDVIEALPV